MVGYKSVQILQETINKYQKGEFVEVANVFEHLIGFLDHMPDEEFTEFRDELKRLLKADRFHFTALYGSGAIKQEQIETIRSKNEVISQLLLSAGLCRFFIGTPPDRLTAIELLKKAINIRPKPKFYTFHEFEIITPEHFKFRMKQDLVKCKSPHVSSIVTENLTEEEADEIISFRDADYFGLIYFILGKMIGDRNLADSCLDIAIRYLERTRSPDFNLLIRGYCCLERGMCNYYMNKYDKAITCYDQTYLFLGRLRKFFKSPGINMGYARSALYRGECNLRLGQSENAVHDLNEANQVIIETKPLLRDSAISFRERFNILMRTKLLLDSLKPTDAPNRAWTAVVSSLPPPEILDSLITISFEHSRQKKT